MIRAAGIVAVLSLLVGCTSWRDIFIDRESLKVHVANAQHAYHRGQYDKAVHQATKALEYDDEDPKALTILGYCYMQVARYASARDVRFEYCEKAEDA